MVKKSKSRELRDMQKARAEQEARDKAKADAEALKNDPVGRMAKEELAKISDSEKQEAAALSEAARDIWADLESTYRACNGMLPIMMGEVAGYPDPNNPGVRHGGMRDKSIHAHMKDERQFNERVRILQADCERFKQELDQIHDMHAHRAKDKTGNRETLAAMEIAELYGAWSVKAQNLLGMTLSELGAMYDEGRRAKLAAETAAQELVDPNVVSDVAFTETPADAITEEATTNTTPQE